jgi:hypothetical protein
MLALLLEMLSDTVGVLTFETRYPDFAGNVLDGAGKSDSKQNEVNPCRISAKTVHKQSGSIQLHTRRRTYIKSFFVTGTQYYTMLHNFYCCSFAAYATWIHLKATHETPIDIAIVTSWQWTGLRKPPFRKMVFSIQNLKKTVDDPKKKPPAFWIDISMISSGQKCD